MRQRACRGVRCVFVMAKFEKEEVEEE